MLSRAQGLWELYGYEQGVICDTCSYRIDGACNITGGDGDSNESNTM